jgi:hypothetical protein
VQYNSSYLATYCPPINALEKSERDKPSEAELDQSPASATEAFTFTFTRCPHKIQDMLILIH